MSASAPLRPPAVTIHPVNESKGGKFAVCDSVLTDAMVRNVILTWYSSTNEHRPVADLEIMLAEDVHMSYPDRSESITGRAAFREWYAGVLKVYFDEVHEVESWDVKVEENRAVATVIVRWEARSWLEGVARSKYEAFISRQCFEIERSAEDGRAYIRKKNVETFEKTAPLFGIGR